MDRSGDVGHHPRPKHLGFPLDLPPIESKIVGADFQSEKSIRGEPVESCKLRYFNSFEFFDHAAYPVEIPAEQSFGDRTDSHPGVNPLPLRPCNSLFTAVRRQSPAKPSAGPRYTDRIIPIFQFLRGSATCNQPQDALLNAAHSLLPPR